MCTKVAQSPIHFISFYLPPFSWFGEVSSVPRIYPSLLEYRPYPLFNNFICATLPESTLPSQNIPPFSTNSYLRTSQNLPLPPRIPPPPSFITDWYLQTSRNLILPARITPPPFSTTICDPPRIYPSLPESTPPPSQQLYDHPIIHPFPPRIYPLSTTICDIQSINPPPKTYHQFQQIYMCDPLRIYPSFPLRIYPALFNNSMWPSQNMPPFQQIYMCDPPKIYSPLSEYTPLFSNYIYNHPIIHPSFSEYTPPPFNNYMRHSQNIPLPLRIYPSSIFYNYMRYSKNLNSITTYGRLFLNYMCMWEILALAPRIKKYSRKGVDSGRVV